MTEKTHGRLFGEGRVPEIEGYQRQFVHWLAGVGLHSPALDVGANTGYLLHYLQQQYAIHGLGLDVAPQATPQVWQHEHVPLVLARGADFAQLLPHDSFGLVTFCHSLEHLPNYTLALKVAHRVLRPGGTLGIAVPYPGSVDWLAEDGSHITLFTESLLLQAVEAAGFAVERATLAIKVLRVDYPEMWLAVWK